MDPSEATNILLSKIKSVEPENASKIMGYLLIQDLDERDLLRMAFAPEPKLRNVINTAKIRLGLLTNTLPASSAPSFSSGLSPVGRGNGGSNPFSKASPRFSSHGFVDFPPNISSQPWHVSALANASTSTCSSGAKNVPASPKSSPFLSYDNIRSGSVLVPPFARNNGCVRVGTGGDCSSSNGGCDPTGGYQLDEYLSFLEESGPLNEEIRVHAGGGYSLNDANAHLLERRSSESDACFGTENGAFPVGFRPCMYFAKGFCKNGDNCKFVHGDLGSDSAFDSNGDGVIVTSPSELEGLYLQQQEEMVRLRAAEHQQRMLCNKQMNFLSPRHSDLHRLEAAGMMMCDEFNNFVPFHPERNDFLAMGMAEKSNSASRQIYLTFPAESTFKDEDVSNYFSTFGPVQDVRIPYQQKRMFGFVTFVHPETVRLILARGNPHFICDSRVLVKPYKEKGKIPITRQQFLQQQLQERGNLSPNLTHPALDHHREFCDFRFGPRMMCSAQELMLRRKMEEDAELQQALELQGRRLVTLQLPAAMRGDHVLHHQQLQNTSVGALISSPSHSSPNHNGILPSNAHNLPAIDDNHESVAGTISSSVASCNGNGEITNDKDNSSHENCHTTESVGEFLPFNLFGSPIKCNQQPVTSTPFPSNEVRVVTQCLTNNHPSSEDDASESNRLYH